ncbi:MAG: hypothetical protein K2G28_04165 [Acetatifactor sp.]|nr:hypothetical protein [Acetatifactor sp.]MDE7353921.1 hypothetical protein [Acetatifactor sp.]
MKKDKTHELRKRLLITLLILAIYMVGRSLLLYKVDPAAYQLEELNSQNIMISMLSGDRYQYTVFALGIMPYITSSLFMWIFMAVRGAEFRLRFSPQRLERVTLALMTVMAVISAVLQADGLVFRESRIDDQILRLIAVAEMTAGAVIIYKMVNVSKEWGIGGQTPVILVNVLDNLASTIQRFTWAELRKSMILCLVMAVVILTMENILIRIPVQRVSIHNAYADKSYIALKLAPIGVMPVMFAVSFFMIPQLIVRFFMLFNEDSPTLEAIYGKLNLTTVTGAVIYLGIIFVLNMVFSFIMLAPDEMAEQLQKNGDSIVGVYAGRKTKRYLRRKLLMLTLFSGSLLCLLMGMSLGMSLGGEILPELALFPATAMILAGILCPLYREIKAYRKFDSLSFFI